ncbi:hypothetical protein [Pueribacillus sp. YX66]|uniref:hypothetical protein n=1 Tax=Pueribacillus sp. YX66 TaxID=3229242 RepID=UPI00358D430D
MNANLQESAHPQIPKDWKGSAGSGSNGSGDDDGGTGKTETSIGSDTDCKVNLPKVASDQKL